MYIFFWHNMWYDVCMRSGRAFQHWCKVQDARCSVRAARVDLIISRHILGRRLALPRFTPAEFIKIPLLWRWRLLRSLIFVWLTPVRYVMPLLELSVRGLLRTGNPRYILAIIRAIRIILLALWPLGFGTRWAIYERMHEGRAEFLQEELCALSARVATLSRIVIAFLVARIHSLVVVATSMYRHSHERFSHPPPEPLVLIPTIRPNAPSV